MKVLIVDDEPAIRFSLSELLSSDGHEVQEAAHAPEALAVLEVWDADIVFTDLRMPRVSGLDLLEAIRHHYPKALVVLVTAHGDERIAVQAMRQGAYDYIPKPFDNEEVRATLRRARELLALRTENVRLREELAGSHYGMVGKSSALEDVKSVIERAGPSDVTVLITGESGTGKELVARALHSISQCSRGPFIALNCAALPSELVESELFGHAKGAFTSASSRREGLFEAASGGTLFLDEIGDLALSAQAKLLRVLETGEVTRLGETSPVSVNVRVIAATNRSLMELERSSRFRSDLRYRLEVLHIAMPPLRDRTDDILPLAVHFLVRASEESRRRAPELSDAVKAALVAYRWPGNIRELQNAMKRAVVLAKGRQLEIADLPDSVVSAVGMRRAFGSTSPPMPLEQARKLAHTAFDREFLEAAIASNEGNISRAASSLGIHRQTLQKMLRRLNIKVQRDDA